ncbi:hypothetical protein N9994_00020 [bacterium]|nr:hypothetical protein [bacterium]
MKKIIITESQYNRIFTEDIKDIFQAMGDVAADSVTAAAGTIPIFGDWLVAFPSMIRNFIQIAEGTEDLNNSIENDSPTEDEVRELQEKIVTDLIDLLQRFLEFLPDPGLSEVASFFTGIRFNIGRALGEDIVVDILSKEEKILKYLKKLESNDAFWNKLTKRVVPYDVIVDSFTAIKDSSDYIKELPTDMQLTSKDRLNKINQKIKSAGLAG